MEIIGIVTLFTTIYASTVTATPTAKVISIPLHNQPILDRRDGGDASVNLTNVFESMLMKYANYDDIILSSTVNINGTTAHEATVSRKQSRKTRRDISSGALTIQEYGPMVHGFYKNVIGTKYQPGAFPAVLDTGSTQLAIPGAMCEEDDGCPGQIKYKGGGYPEGYEGDLSYGGRFRFRGDYYQDDVTFAGLTARQMSFLCVKYSKLPLLTATGDSLSVLGFGLRRDAGPGIPKPKPSFFQHLIQQGELAAPEFAFFLGRIASGTSDKSRVTIGHREESQYTGQLVTAPVTSASFWQVEVTGTTVGDVDLGSLAKGHAVTDTGGSGMVAPFAVVERIFKEVKGAFQITAKENLSPSTPSDTAYYAYPCDTDPRIAFVIGGVKLAINPLDLSMGRLDSNADLINDSGRKVFSFVDVARSTTFPLEAARQATTAYCVASLVGANLAPKSTHAVYLLGSAFLRNWYTGYSLADNKPTISFAAAKGNND